MEIKMVKRTYDLPDEEPEQVNFKLPSPKEHLFQVTDVYTSNDCPKGFNLDDNTVVAKCEVVGGDEEGLSLLQRLSLDQDWKGFFATKLFLKAIGEKYKGKGIEIDTDLWIGRQFYAVVVHNESKGKTYANIDTYNFDKNVEQFDTSKNNKEEIVWEP